MTCWKKDSPPPAAVAAIIAVSMAAWSPGVLAALAASQDQPVESEIPRIQLEVVVTRTAGGQEPAEASGNSAWRFEAMTASGQDVRMEDGWSRFSAAPSLLDDGRIAVELSVMVRTPSSGRLSAPPVGQPPPPTELVINLRPGLVVLEDSEPTVAAALTDEADRRVEVTITATAGTQVGARRRSVDVEDRPFVANVAAAPRVPAGSAVFFLRQVAQTVEEVDDLPAGAILPVSADMRGDAGFPPCPEGWREGRDEDGYAIFAPALAHVRSDGLVVDGNGVAGPLVGRDGRVRIPLQPVCVKE